MKHTLPFFLILLVALADGCDRRSRAVSATGGCDESIKLPEGFCATVFAESAGPVRHLAVRKNGDVIAGVLDQRRTRGGLVVLRDTNHDGHADLEARVGEEGVHGVALGSDSSLYVSTATSVLHYRFGADLAPNPRYDTLITGLPQRRPQSHSLAIDPRNNLIVNIGAASEGCQPTPTPNTPGRDPCPELDSTGGLWSFRTDQTMQGLRNGVRIATGLHNAVALTVNPRDTSVYAVSHGRDMLHEFWPALYSDLDGATAAAEEMIRVASMRADYGWPYCYYSYFANQRVVAPEYGGDKHQTTRCGRQIQPLTVFPAHWAPMAMLFYTGTAFPPAYRTGVFVAFHGSALRAPLPQEGYVVAYVAFKDGLPAGETQIFANGFAGGMMSPEGAEHRPTGLAQDAAGALYVSDDKGGRIWKITWRGAGKD